MSAGTDLRIPLGELTRHPGQRRPVVREVVLGDLAVADTALDPGRPVRLEAEAEAIAGGVVVTGTLVVPWNGTCRRCLEPVAGDTTAEVHEIFEPEPTEGETYPLGRETLDLEPMLRDAVLLALPLAPLCRPDCAGPDPERFPTGPAGDDGRPVDPRWAALDQIRFDQ